MFWNLFVGIVYLLPMVVTLYCVFYIFYCSIRDDGLKATFNDDIPWGTVLTIVVAAFIPAVNIGSAITGVSIVSE